jgi:opacity protein-like surface antigen
MDARARSARVERRDFVMANLKVLVLASGAVLALVGSAAAADLLPPPPVLEPPPPAAAEFTGWYLRGDVGVGVNANTPNLFNTPNPAAGTPNSYYSVVPTQSFYNSTISAATNFDLGIGYQVNNWLRFDVTGEYRGGSHFQSLYVLNDAGNTGTGPIQLADFYRGDISSWVGLVNGYLDMGTWSGVTPYIGAGVGLARNTLSGMTDQGVVTAIGGAASPSGGYFNDGSKFNFAWALMTGLDFNVTQNLKLELGYRFLDLGKYSSGGSYCLGTCGGGVPNYVVSKNDLAYNDFRIGLRWMIGDEQAYAPPPTPLVRKY